MEIDTDSTYLMISVPTRDEFFQLVKPELQAEFDRVKSTFVATKETMREPGLFKSEW